MGKGVNPAKVDWAPPFLLRTQLGNARQHSAPWAPWGTQHPVCRQQWWPCPMHIHWAWWGSLLMGTPVSARDTKGREEKLGEKASTAPCVVASRSYFVTSTGRLFEWESWNNKWKKESKTFEFMHTSTALKLYEIYSKCNETIVIAHFEMNQDNRVDLFINFRICASISWFTLWDVNVIALFHHSP